MNGIRYYTPSELVYLALDDLADTTRDSKKSAISAVEKAISLSRVGIEGFYHKHPYIHDETAKELLEAAYYLHCTSEAFERDGDYRWVTYTERAVHYMQRALALLAPSKRGSTHAAA